MKQTSNQKHWYRNDPALIYTVQYCVERNLKNKETLAIIFAQLGSTISEKKLQRIKKTLPKTNQQKLEIINQDTAGFVLESIKVLKFGEQIAFKILQDSASHPYIKLQSLGMILKYREKMADFYDSSPVLTSLADKLAGGNNVISEHKKVSGKEQLTGSSPSS